MCRPAFLIIGVSSAHPHNGLARAPSPYKASAVAGHSIVYSPLSLTAIPNGSLATLFIFAAYSHRLFPYWATLCRHNQCVPYSLWIPVRSCVIHSYSLAVRIQPTLSNATHASFDIDLLPCFAHAFQDSSNPFNHQTRSFGSRSVWDCDSGICRPHRWRRTLRHGSQMKKPLLKILIKWC